MRWWPHGCVVVAAIAACLQPRAAAGDETSDAEVAAPAVFSGTTAAVLEWRTDNRNGMEGDDHFGDAILRTNLSLDAGETRVYTRIDGELFLDAPPGFGRRNSLRMERVALELDRPLAGSARVSATLGDFYAQFGHGLVLSLRAVDELGLDVAARGARTDFTFLDDRVLVTALGAFTNPVNIELQQLRHTEDPHDALVGTRGELRLDEVSVGFHGAGVREANPALQDERRSTINYGGTLDAWLGDLNVSLEVDGQTRTVAGQRRSGLAGYGTATVRLGRATLQGELKHYRRFEPLAGGLTTFEEGRYQYAFPPTVERIDQELIDNTDITGGRLRVDLTTGQETASSAHANLALFHNRLFGQWFAHGYGGIDQRWTGGVALLVSGGYRREWDDRTSDLARAIAHAELDLMTPVSRRHSLHLIAQHQSHVEALGGQRYIFHRGNSSLELDLQNRWVLAAGFDWNTQDQRAEVRRLFGFGVVRYRAGDRLILALLAGSQRGGIRCIAGACRNFPPFSGVRLDITWRF